jgi:hypothetical protein
LQFSFLSFGWLQQQGEQERATWAEQGWRGGEDAVEQICGLGSLLELTAEGTAMMAGHGRDGVGCGGAAREAAAKLGGSGALDCSNEFCSGEEDEHEVIEHGLNWAVLLFFCLLSSLPVVVIRIGQPCVCRRFVIDDD